MDYMIPSAATTMVAVQAALVGLVGYWVCRSIYRLYFHPLAQFPGPKLAAIGDLWWAVSYTGGFHPMNMEKVHKKYGPVVRVSPRDLSFATVEAYRDIYMYTMREKDKILIKGDMYANRGLPNIHNERDPEKHAKMRKKLAPAFSTKKLRYQESVIQDHIDTFIKKIGELGKPGGDGISLKTAFEWLTFDIAGQLTFGQSFGATAAAKSNFWVEAIQPAFYLNSMATLRKRVPLIKLLMLWTMPKGFIKTMKIHAQQTEEKVQQRLEKGGANQDDFFGHMFKDADRETVYNDMLAQSMILMIGASDTTKVFFIGVTYFLMRNPDCLAKLADEIRANFSSSDEITGDATARLEYLNAVIEEGLRIWPNVPAGMSREVPQGGSVISGYHVPAGTGVRVSPWPVNYDPNYWHEPQSFKPERWIGEGFGDRKDASQPFSLGPRGCLGMNLAYIEMRVVLAKMAFAYDWELVSKDVDLIRDSRSYMTWVTPHIQARFHPRHVTEKTALEEI